MLPLAAVAGYAEGSEPNSFGTGEGDEEDPNRSRWRGRNHCGFCMGNKPGAREQGPADQEDCRGNCGRSAVVYADLLHRRQTASATVRRLQPGRPMDRSSEDTWRRARTRAYAPARRTG